MPRWLLPWLFPIGLLVVVMALGATTLVGAVGAALIAAGLALAVGLIGVPFVYRAYQDNRAAGRGDSNPRPRRADPPNNRSLLR